MQYINLDGDGDGDGDADGKKFDTPLPPNNGQNNSHQLDNRMDTTNLTTPTISLPLPPSQPHTQPHAQSEYQNASADGDKQLYDKNGAVETEPPTITITKQHNITSRPSNKNQKAYGQSSGSHDSKSLSAQYLTNSKLVPAEPLLSKSIRSLTEQAIQNWCAIHLEPKIIAAAQQGFCHVYLAMSPLIDFRYLKCYLAQKNSSWLVEYWCTEATWKRSTCHGEHVNVGKVLGPKAVGSEATCCFLRCCSIGSRGKPSSSKLLAKPVPVGQSCKPMLHVWWS